MTPQQIHAMKQALEALKYWDVHGKLHQPTEEAITAIKEALAEHAMQEVQRLGQEIEQEPVSVYGYCPECGAKGVMRERRPNGNDKCANGHTYPSSTSTLPQRTEQEHFGFAGVKMWVGGKQVVKLLTQTEFHYATQPWLDMLMIAEKCLVELREKNA